MRGAWRGDRSGAGGRPSPRPRWSGSTGRWRSSSRVVVAADALDRVGRLDETARTRVADAAARPPCSLGRAALSWRPCGRDRDCVIVGRSRELALLEQTLDGAARGGASRLLLVGEAGIGKTALLEVAADLAAAGGFRVLRAGGLQGGRQVPYAVVSDLVRPAGAALGELSDADAAVLGGLSAGTQASPARVGAALLQLVAVLAESGPLLVTVDDVHWADPGSRQALALAAGRLHTEPVAVLAATRPVAMDDPDLVRWPMVELGALAPDDALTLLRASVQQIVPESVGRRLVAALGGNPLALRECGRILPVEVLAGRQPLPDPLPVGQAVQAAYARSVRELSDRTARALLVLAVVGRGGRGPAGPGARGVGARDRRSRPGGVGRTAPDRSGARAGAGAPAGPQRGLPGRRPGRATGDPQRSRLPRRVSWGWPRTSSSPIWPRPPPDRTNRWPPPSRHRPGGPAPPAGRTRRSSHRRPRPGCRHVEPTRSPAGSRRRGCFS